MYSPENGTCIYVDVALPVERVYNDDDDGGWWMGVEVRFRESRQSQFPKVTKHRTLSLEEIPKWREGREGGGVQ